MPGRVQAHDAPGARRAFGPPSSSPWANVTLDIHIFEILSHTSRNNRTAWLDIPIDSGTMWHSQLVVVTVEDLQMLNLCRAINVDRM